METLALTLINSCISQQSNRITWGTHLLIKLGTGSFFIPAFPTSDMHINSTVFTKMSFLFIFFKGDIYFERERESGGGTQKEGERDNPKCYQHRAQCKAQTREPGDHDLSQSQTPNPLSHPGAPVLSFVCMRFCQPIALNQQ